MLALLEIILMRHMPVGGVTWAFTDHFQWDAGIVVGLNDDAEDLNTFTGFTVKF